MFITKSKSQEKLKTGIEFTGKTQKNKVELSQSSRCFIFRISVQCMATIMKFILAPSYDFTQTHCYFNPASHSAPQLGLFTSVALENEVPLI